jgi:hypothetical protein
VGWAAGPPPPEATEGAESTKAKVVILGHITASRLLLEKCIVDE